MKLINNRWTDDKNNSWDANKLTAKEALIKSNSLINCKDCKDCECCNNCNNCESCYDCNYCNNCNYCNCCSSCFNCKHCERCYSCYSCENCESCKYSNCCKYCHSCTNTNNCNNCEHCEDCEGYKTNPQRLTSPLMGSRNAQTSIYWTTEKDVQVICGCFQGNFEEFKEAVEGHPNELHRHNYLSFIALAESLINFNPLQNKE